MIQAPDRRVFGFVRPSLTEAEVYGFMEQCKAGGVCSVGRAGHVIESMFWTEEICRALGVTLASKGIAATVKNLEGWWLGLQCTPPAWARVLAGERALDLGDIAVQKCEKLQRKGEVSTMEATYYDYRPPTLHEICKAAPADSALAEIHKRAQELLLHNAHLTQAEAILRAADSDTALLTQYQLERRGQ